MPMMMSTILKFVNSSKTDLNSFRSRVFLKVVFSTNKKTIHYPFRALVMVKNGFLAEVTFNNDIQLRRIAFEY